MYFFLSFPMVLLVSQNFSILTSKETLNVLYLKNYIFNIFFWPARSKEEEILNGYSLFLHRGFLIFSRYYSRNTRRSASRRARRASLQHWRAAAFIHSPFSRHCDLKKSQKNFILKYFSNLWINPFAQGSISIGKYTKSTATKNFKAMKSILL